MQCRHTALFILILIAIHTAALNAQQTLNASFSPVADPWNFPAEGVELKEKPQVLVFELETLPAEKKTTWIQTRQDIQALLPLSMKSFIDVFLDFPGQVGFLPRLAKIEVLAQSDAYYEMRQFYEIRIMGYVYPTVYDMSYKLIEDPDSKRAAILWNLLDSDGSIGGSEGGWYIEEVAGKDGPAIKVRNLNVGRVRKDFPLQAQIMKLAGPGELEGIVKAILKEAKRRGLK